MLKLFCVPLGMGSPKMGRQHVFCRLPHGETDLDPLRRRLAPKDFRHRILDDFNLSAIQSHGLRKPGFHIYLKSAGAIVGNIDERFTKGKPQTVFLFPWSWGPGHGWS